MGCLVGVSKIPSNFEERKKFYYKEKNTKKTQLFEGTGYGLKLRGLLLKTKFFSFVSITCLAIFGYLSRSFRILQSTKLWNAYNSWTLKPTALNFSIFPIKYVLQRFLEFEEGSWMNLHPLSFIRNRAIEQSYSKTQQFLNINLM